MNTSNPMLAHQPEEFYTGATLGAAIAIRQRNYPALRAAIKQSSVCLTDRGNKDLSLLGWALGHDDPESFNLLLDAGASPNDFLMIQGSKTSLISIASGAKKLDYLKLLITHKANPNGLPGTEAPLSTALLSGHRERMELLVAAGADLNVPDSAGATAIIEVVLANDYILALKLVAMGANPNVVMKNGNSIRKAIDRFPLPENTPQGEAQRKLLKLLR